MLLLLGMSAALMHPATGFGRSAHSPRHSGMEPPGGPRTMEALPGQSPSRTPMGGMGYTDAYGNELGTPREEAKTVRKRLRPGANSNQLPQDHKTLPIPSLQETRPLWKF